MHTLSALALSLAAASTTLAQSYPPPIVYARNGVSFPSGSDSLSFTFANFFYLDDAGRAWLSANVYRNGSTNYEPAILQCDGSTTQVVGDRTNFGGALLPPTTQTASFEYFGASASGNVFANVSAGLETSIIMKPAASARRAITDMVSPAPGVAAIGAVRMGIASSNWIAVQSGSDDVWLGDTSQTPVPFTRVIQKNAQAPGMPAGVLINGGPARLAVNASGAFASQSGLTGTGITSANSSVIYVGDSASASVLVQTGTPTPGISDGTFLQIAPNNQFDTIAMNDAGEVAFNAGINSATRGGKAIYFGRPGNIVPIAKCGTSTIPGLPGRVNELRFSMSPNGHRVIFCGVDTAGAPNGYNSSGLITGTTDAPQVIVRSGQTAPGLPAGTVLWNMREFIVNDLGWVAFRADFSPSTTYPSGGTALFGWSGGPGINLVLGPDQPIVIDGIPTTVRPNTSPTFFAFNAQGIVAITIGFNSGPLANTGGVIGRNIYQLPPPVGFSLSTPIANSQSISVEPTFTWTASSNADSYLVSVTPEGSATQTYSVTGTSFTVPAGILSGCQNVTWGVSAVNVSGNTPSTPPTQNFTTFSLGCITPPVYSLQNIGLDGAVYSTPQITHVTPEGRVGGYNSRGISTSIGQDAWVWDGAMSPALGLRGGLYEGFGTATDTKRSSSITAINAQGKVVGTSARYAFGGSGSAGADAWYFDGATTSLIGPTGAGYEMNPAAAAPLHSHSPAGISPTGLVIGGSIRWSPTGNGGFRGSDAWTFDGTSTSIIGLSGPGYDYTTAGEIFHDSSPVAINSSNQILGTSTRYTSTGATLGFETWIKAGSSYSTVLITGAPYEFTNANGLNRSVSGKLFNDAGQVAGFVSRRNAAGQVVGNDAFFWSAGAFQIIDLADAVHTNPTTGARGPDVKRMTSTGMVVGENARYAADGSSLGSDVWFFDGTQTRLLSLQGSQYQNNPAAPDSAALKLHHFVAMNASGQVLGTSELWTNGPSNRPSTGWLFDPATGQTTIIQLLAGFTSVPSGMSLSDTGMVVGPSGASSFIWSAQTGMRLLSSRVLGGLQPQGWNALNTPFGGAGAASHGWSSLITGTGDYPTSFGRRGFVLTYVPAPGGFPLLSPPDNAHVDAAITTHSWDASPGAQSYTVGFTPDGGTTTVVQTTGTTVTLPAGLASGCERITWTVVANAPTGSTVSTPPTRTYTYIAADFNHDGAVGVSDIFDFLAAWFAADGRTDFDHSGTLGVQDIFTFLAMWFQSCP